MDRSTIDYYEKNADTYAEKTRYVYMHDTRSAFLNCIDPAGRIADIGCGGGRDMKIFEELGYTADGIDASPAMCRAASEYTGNVVKCVDIKDWQSQYNYSGIWASASLLHLKEDEFFAFFRRVKKALSSDGVIYFSMKADIVDGYDEKGRWYLGFDDKRLRRILSENPEYEQVKYWITGDNLKRGIEWINVILRKVR
ncbi:MAG: class I SAM-dependent methyltransferase [Eubacteriales bacterium]|nr:class I SAM-dependent methyltransferase [Eubacteriales bacterium]